MRRIYKTTTAIVTCLALAAPQLALAQDQQNADPAASQILTPGQKAKAKAAQEAIAREKAAAEAAVPEKAPQKAPAKPAPEAPKTAEAPKPAKAKEQAREQAKLKEQEQAKAKAEQAKAKAEQAKAKEQANEPAAKPAKPKAQLKTEAEPAAPAAKAQPEALAPAGKPPVTQAAEPMKKPALTQAETPAAKPADAAATAERTQILATEAQKLPKAKPDSPEAVTAADPAPKVKPKPEAAAKPAPKAEPAPTPKAAAETATGGVIGTEALREKLEAEAATQGAKPRPAPTARTAEAPVELPAPEAKAAPNAVAERAAKKVAPATAAALSAGSDQARGKSDEVAITQENTRSSAEDFTTSVMQGLKPAEATREARDNKDDDDDSKRDIAKLLLAGAAGFAVGKMLSNDREVALNTGDRVVVTLPDGSQQVIKDDNALLYRPGSNVRTETFEDGSSRTTVLREDGSRVVTIRDADMNILRRTLIRADGSETQLIDDTTAEPVRVSTLPAPPPVEVIRGPLDEEALREALRRETAIERGFSLGQIRDIPEVRALVAPVNLPEITFDTGSAAITPDQARQLATLGKVIRDSIDNNPREIYMIEGYTDAIGSNAANLALSDRRAELVALALTEYFQVPPENMVVQGYGEQFLLVPTDQAERQNRRVALRRITDLLAAR